MSEERIRVTRTIVIEGPKPWVNQTLESSHLQPAKGKVPMGPRGGYLEELERVVENV